MKAIHIGFKPYPALIEQPDLLDRRIGLPAWGPFPGLYVYISTRALIDRLRELTDENTRLRAQQRKTNAALRAALDKLENDSA